MDLSAGIDLRSNSYNPHQILVHLKSGWVKLPGRVLKKNLGKTEARVSTQTGFVSLFPYPKPGIATVFTRDMVWTEAGSGELIQKKPYPLETLNHFGKLLIWDSFDQFYFLGSVLWSAFALPGALSQDGVRFRPSSFGSQSAMEVTFPKMSAAPVPLHYLVLDEKKTIREIYLKVEFLRLNAWIQLVFQTHAVRGYWRGVGPGLEPERRCFLEINLSS